MTETTLEMKRPPPAANLINLYWSDTYSNSIYNEDAWGRRHALPSYIQKTGLACWKIPQKIQIFRRKIVSERENYQFCNVLEKDQQASSKTKVS